MAGLVSAHSSLFRCDFGHTVAIPLAPDLALLSTSFEFRTVFESKMEIPMQPSLESKSAVYSKPVP
jgi:hypothetical protein